MPLHPVVRRGVRLLGAGFALNLAAFALTAGPGSVAMVRLTGDLGSSGLYFTTYLLASAAGAALSGRAMDRWGRRRVLVAAYGMGTVGYALAGFGVAAGSLHLFAIGVAVLSLAGGAIGLTRVAAADMFPAAQRGKAVAFILVAATAGAVVGPIALLGSDPLGVALGRDPAVLVWWLAAPLMMLGALLVARAPESLEIARDLARYHPDALQAPGVAAAPAGPMPRLPLVAGLFSLALALAAMVGVMGVAGAALTHEGHGLPSIGLVLALHFLAMYAFALKVGRIADRVGRKTTILSGLALLGSGGGLIAAWPEPAGLALGLVLIGLGWCFAYLGGTVLVTDITPLSRRARVLGATDLGSALLGALVSASAGVLLARSGLGSVGLMAAVLMLAPFVLVSLVREARPQPVASAA